jgi:hypothetical protein
VVKNYIKTSSLLRFKAKKYIPLNKSTLAHYNANVMVVNDVIDHNN